jgi:uncharacterized oligopeptide transporter (OPT) family protein
VKVGCMFLNVLVTKGVALLPRRRVRVGAMRPARPLPLPRPLVLVLLAAPWLPFAVAVPVTGLVAMSSSSLSGISTTSVLIPSVLLFLFSNCGGLITFLTGLPFKSAFAFPNPFDVVALKFFP